MDWEMIAVGLTIAGGLWYFGFRLGAITTELRSMKDLLHQFIDRVATLDKDIDTLKEEISDKVSHKECIHWRERMEDQDA